MNIEIIKIEDFVSIGDGTYNYLVLAESKLKKRYIEARIVVNNNKLSIDVHNQLVTYISKHPLIYEI